MTDGVLNQKITDEERLELAAKLDGELNDFIDGLEKQQYSEGWPEDRWEEEMAKHPFFMTKAPEDGEELSPLMEGLQQLKYDPSINMPEELAKAYKEDGNFNFKHKKYRVAIIAYTEGIRIKCGDRDLDAALYNNRAAANFALQNYRSSLQDCELALKIKPKYEKTIMRAANCCSKISKYEKALEYCDIIIGRNGNHKEMLDLRKFCVSALKNRERDKRKQLLKESKVSQQMKLLFAVIKARGLNLDGTLNLENLKPTFPQLSEHRVSLDETNKLIWPVVFLYPEYNIMDFLQHFSEDETFIDHLHNVFEDNPEWNEDRKYVPQNLSVYFKNVDTNEIFPVDVNKTLGETLALKQYIIQSGTPSFLITVKNSASEAQLLNK